MQANTIIHIDAHPDLLLPTSLLADDVFDTEALFREVSISSFLLPLVYSGQLRRIVWIKPSWAEQIPEGRYEFFIGKHRDTGTLMTNSSLAYFLNEQLSCDYENLLNAQAVVLDVVSACAWKPSADGEPTSVNVTLPHDLVRFLRESDDKKYILDICLDFFSCRNPFREEAVSLCDGNDASYESLAAFYREFLHPDPVAGTDALPEWVSVRREAVAQFHRHMLETLRAGVFRQPLDVFEAAMDTLTSTSLRAGVNTASDGAQARIRLLQLALQRIYRGQQMQPGLTLGRGASPATGTAGALDEAERIARLHLMGCMWDLPHHVTEWGEIAALSAAVDTVLQSLPAPTIVTIARSAADNYTPPAAVESIQSLVLRMLRRRYPLMEVLHEDHTQ